MLIILALLAVASFAGTIVLFQLQVLAPAAVFHLAFAVGVMPLILGAMSHFVPVLSRSAAPHSAVRLLPLLMLVAGALAFFSLAVGHQDYTAAASLAFGVAVLFAVWIVRRAAVAVGSPHPCLYWYLAAIGCLLLALLAVIAMAAWPQHYPSLKRFHLHLNTLGFVGLTAVATLQVLLPTVVARSDPQAATRLRLHLKWALGGTLLIALGAAWYAPLAYLGCALWALPLLQLGRSWRRLSAGGILRRDGAASSLAAAYAGLCIVLLFGAGHASGSVNSADTLFAFILAFLLPLVTGAASQLLPVWFRPGMQTAWHEQVRQQLGAGGAYRAGLFLFGGLAVGLGWHAWIMLTLAALLMFLWQLAATLRRHLIGYHSGT